MTAFRCPVRLSIVIPSFNSARTIERCLRSLDSLPAGSEIIVVDSSIDGSAGIVRERFPHVRLIHYDERLYPGKARNLGSAAASGDVLAFLDSDTWVAPDWAAETARAYGKEYAAVGGSLHNGNPDSLVAWAHYLFEFSAWLPQGPDREQNEIPGGCLSIRKPVFERYGPFPDHTYSEDSVLSRRMRAAGERLLFAPSIRVFHINREELWSVARDKCSHGRDFALQRPVYSRLLYACGTPLLPVLLLWRIARRVWPERTLRGRLFRAFPMIALLAVSWSLGELRGYLGGPQLFAQVSRGLPSE